MPSKAIINCGADRPLQSVCHQRRVYNRCQSELGLVLPEALLVTWSVDVEQLTLSRITSRLIFGGGLSTSIIDKNTACLLERTS